MAHLNCPSCHHGMMWMPHNPWDFGGGFPHGRSSSNQSLHMTPAHQAFGPPSNEGFLGPTPWQGGPWHPSMYPGPPHQPPPMHPFMQQQQVHPSQVHAHRVTAPSPAPSGKLSQHDQRRTVSPAQSNKSRRSHTSFSRRSVRPPLSSERSSSSSSSEGDQAIDSEDECDAAPSPPPPVRPIIPQHEWECEHCTFVNRAGVRVCAVCCKTPCDLAQSPPRPQKRSSRRSSEMSTRRDSKSSKRHHFRQELPSEESDVESKSVTAKFNKQLRISQKNRAESNEDVHMRSPERETSLNKKKGRPLRKISFWPGTKFYH